MVESKSFKSIIDIHPLWPTLSLFGQLFLCLEAYTDRKVLEKKKKTCHINKYVLILSQKLCFQVIISVSVNHFILVITNHQTIFYAFKKQLENGWDNLIFFWLVRNNTTTENVGIVFTIFFNDWNRSWTINIIFFFFLQQSFFFLQFIANKMAVLDWFSLCIMVLKKLISCFLSILTLKKEEKHIKSGHLRI